MLLTSNLSDCISIGKKCCRSAVLASELIHGLLSLSAFAQTKFPASADASVSEGGLVHKLCET